MKFKSILRKPHVPDKDAVAHPWLTIRITKEKEVIAVNAETFLRQLGTPFTSFLNR